MKKSTIFLLVLVYIVSFIIVGLFGIQVRAHDQIIYVDSITLKAVDEVNVHTTYDEENKIYKFWTYYPDESDDEKRKIQFVTEVLPANATNRGIEVILDNPNVRDVKVDKEFIDIYLNEGGIGTIDFSVVSTDGNNLTIDAKLTIRARI